MNNNHAWSKSRYSVVNAKQGRLQKPVVIILFGYSLILIPSTLILMTEFASVTGLDWIDALFTATSALTVTGLGVVDTGTHFSAVGQVWLMLLMQLGGLGQMTLSVLILLTLGKSIGLKEQAVVREELNQDFGTDIVSLIKVIIVFALTMELIGTVILSAVWVPEFGLAQGIYTAVFHSISSFNNAGFSLFSASMSDYSHSPIVTLTISLLFIIGGLGFTVIIDLIKIKKNDHSKKRYTLSLHTKLVLIGSFVLLFGGAIAIGLLESNNSKTLGGHDLLSTSLMAFFQSATARTAGFYSINIIDMTHAGLLVMMVLMFIGAGSTSTGGGIKVSTFVVAIIATRSFLKGSTRFPAFKRNIAPLVVLKALAIIVVSFAILLTSAFALMLTEDARFDVVLFEAISAFSTVGLTAGLTENLSPTGKFIMIFLMIIGRIGPITLALLAASPNTSRIKYADEEVITG
jgi:trk system potassium uptake protein TrkH